MKKPVCAGRKRAQLPVRVSRRESKEPLTSSKHLPTIILPGPEGPQRSRQGSFRTSDRVPEVAFLLKQSGHGRRLERGLCGAGLAVPREELDGSRDHLDGAALVPVGVLPRAAAQASIDRDAPALRQEL